MYRNELYANILDIFMFNLKYCRRHFRKSFVKELFALSVSIYPSVPLAGSQGRLMTVGLFTTFQSNSF